MGRGRQFTWALVALAAALVAASAPGHAQEFDPSSETTTTISPDPDATTTTLPDTPTTTTVPPTTTTTQPVPSLPPGPPPDVPDEPAAEPPPDPLPVPPPAHPREPTPADVLTSSLVATTLETATQTLATTLTLDHTMAALAVKLEAEVGQKEVRLNELRQGRRTAQVLLAEKREEAKRHAIAAYTGSTPRRLNLVLEVRDANDLARRLGFISAVADADRRAVREYLHTKDAAEADLSVEEADVEATRLIAQQARQQANQATELRVRRELEVASLQLGGALAINGFVFPVDDPHTFADTFGAPRMTGTAYAHKHQGTDIFAPYGTPLRAVERGVITRVGVDLLGGNKLWLVGASGTRYYYAHLSGYAPGLAEGTVVEAGALVGYVGNTGNARTTPPHLHIEVHPGGGPAVDPYPLLKAADDAAKAVRAGR